MGAEPNARAQPKTEHHDGGESRFVPLFPELRPYLLDAFSQAEEGTEFVITRCRNSKTNLRTQMERIIRRSGLKPWPKLFHNLRSTRRSSLATSSARGWETAGQSRRITIFK